jgi:mRNA-degrading endonuclease toxin of MazEF toxin-antitoxin module
MIRRGDVVMVEFPYTDAAQSKVRPAVVVLNDRDNQRLRKTVVAMITGNLRRKGDPSHLFIDPAAEPSSGLRYPSLVSCNNLLTVEHTDIRQTIGHLSDVLKLQLNGCLKAALEPP